MKTSSAMDQYIRVLLLLLAFSVLVTEAPHGLPQVFFVFGVYLLAYFINQQVFKSNLLSTAQQKPKGEKNLFFRGNLFPSLEDVDSEKIYLLNVGSVTRVAARRWVTRALFAGIVFLFYKAHQSGKLVTTPVGLFHILTAMTFLPMEALSHSLLTLGLNIVLMTYYFAHAEPSQPVLAVFYYLGLFVTLGMYGLCDLNAKFARSATFNKRFKSSFFLGLQWLILVGLISLLAPGESLKEKLRGPFESATRTVSKNLQQGIESQLPNYDSVQQQVEGNLGTPGGAGSPGSPGSQQTGDGSSGSQQVGNVSPGTQGPGDGSAGSQQAGEGSSSAANDSAAEAAREAQAARSVAIEDLKAHRQQVQEMLKKLGANPNQLPQGGASREGSQPASGNSEPNLKDGPPEPPAQPPSEQEIAQLKRQFEELSKKSPEQLQKEIAELQKLDQKMGEMQKTLENAPLPTQASNQNRPQGNPPTPNPGDHSAQPGNQASAPGDQSAPPAGQPGENGHQQVGAQPPQNPSGTPNNPSTAQPPQTQTPANQSPELKPPELPKLDDWWPFIKIAFAILIIVLLTSFLAPYFQKTDIKKVEQPKLNRKDRRKLAAFLSATQNTQYRSAQDEVIKKYHAFLEVMEFLNRARPEGLPAEDYGHWLQDELKRNHQEIKALTDGFSDVLYGEKNLDTNRLNDFRRSFNEMARTFTGQ